MDQQNQSVLSTDNPTGTTPEAKINRLQLFHDLTGESYYGLNMRIILLEQSPEFVQQLDQFVKDCKARRGA